MENEEIASLKKRIDALEARIAKVEALFQSGTAVEVKPESLREYVIKKGPKSAVDKTAVIAYYLEMTRCREGFGLRDIREGFHEAKEKQPGNLSEAIRQNEKRGYFMESKTPGSEKGITRWVMTNTGIAFVDGLNNAK